MGSPANGVCGPRATGASTPSDTARTRRSSICEGKRGSVSSTTLRALARICTKPNAGAQDVVDACALLRDALGAEDAYVIRAGDPDFIRIGCPCPPSDYEIKQKGYWLIWQQGVRNPQFSARPFRRPRRHRLPGRTDRGAATEHPRRVRAARRREQLRPADHPRALAGRLDRRAARGDRSGPADPRAPRQYRGRCPAARTLAGTTGIARERLEGVQRGARNRQRASTRSPRRWRRLRASPGW